MIRSLGLIVKHPDGRIERFRDNGDGTYTNEAGQRVENPTFYEGCDVGVVPGLINERTA